MPEALKKHEHWVPEALKKYENKMPEALSEKHQMDGLPEAPRAYDYLDASVLPGALIGGVGEAEETS